MNSQPILETPSPQELQVWADEAQACVDSGELIISDPRKARATIDALRSHAALKARVAELEGALRSSVVAIDDWLHSYAGEFCDEVHVEETAKRLSEYGTIGYIANVQEKNRAALSHAGPVARDGER
jgi:hypothetical protein